MMHCNKASTARRPSGASRASRILVGNSKNPDKDHKSPDKDKCNS